MFDGFQHFITFEFKVLVPTRVFPGFRAQRGFRAQSDKDKQAILEIPKWWLLCDLQVEIKPVAPQWKSKIKCEFPGCNKMYNRVRDMKRHMNSAHTREVNYVCPHCSKTFQRKDYLKVHLEKKNKCSSSLKNNNSGPDSAADDSFLNSLLNYTNPSI